MGLARFGFFVWLTINSLLSVHRLYGQVVQIGPADPDACEKVKVNPNLVIESAAEVKGHLEDPSGAARVHTRIKVRKYVSQLKQSSFKEAQTDADGDFSVGVLPAGKYRFLVFSPGFGPPRHLQCIAGKSCQVDVVAEVLPTDTFPESVCPPK
jgi:hypothetical protein